MDNKIIALIVIILVVIVGAVYILANPGNTNQTASANNTNITNTTNNSTTSTITNETSSKSSNNTNSTPNVKISAAQAQKIAVESSEELGGQIVTAGTPTLFKWTANKLHTWVWNVPLYDAKTKKSVGPWYVDAYTGASCMNE